MIIFSSLLKGLARITLRHPVVVLLLGLLITTFSVLAAKKIEIRSSFSDLLPDDHPAVIQAKELDRIVGGASFIVVATESKNAEAADRFLGDLRQAVSRHKGIRYIDDEPPHQFIKKNGLLYLTAEELAHLKDKIQRQISQEKLKKTNLFIDLEENSTDLSGEFTKLREEYQSYLGGTHRYQNKEGTLFVSLIKPDWRATEISKTEPFVSDLNRIIADLNPQKYDPGLSVRLTGPYIKALTQRTILERDATLLSFISLLGAILYLIFHFRGLRPVFLISLPLIVSLSWTLGVAYWIFHSLNLFSASACAIVLGLAADYGIHIFSEWKRHRQEGRSVEEALSEAVEHLGRPFAAASFTTSAAFLALSLSRFKAFFELGIIAGISIILCVVAFVFLFPPLVLLTEKWFPSKSGFLKTERRFSFSAQWVFSKYTFIASSLLLLLPLIMIPQVRFDYDLNKILGEQETKNLDQQVDTIFNRTVNPEVVLTTVPEDAPRLASSLREVQKKQRASSIGTTFKTVLSLQDFVPEDQEEKIKIVREIRSLFTSAILQRLGPEERGAYEDFKIMLRPEKIRLDSLPVQITQKFSDREGGLGRMVFIFPNFSIQESEKLMRFVEEVREAQCPDCSGPFHASGESTLFYEIVKMLSREGKYVIGFALLTILGALLINFRTISSTLTAFIPLGVGLLATLGWMGVLGIPFNIINLAALPIILGTADDYTIHFYERVRSEPHLKLGEVYTKSFQPIVGSALTTLIGFGSLIFANMGGVRSFGTLCCLGISCCAITTLFWFPSLLDVLQKRKKSCLRLRERELATQETVSESANG
ncbi:MAG: MMPL family transporter [Deltaproteobacteria bacterium]|nr:MMPL family transporter [Deltaproteobacteria bacterium]